MRKQFKRAPYNYLIKKTKYPQHSIISKFRKRHFINSCVSEVQTVVYLKLAQLTETHFFKRVKKEKNKEKVGGEEEEEKDKKKKKSLPAWATVSESTKSKLATSTSVGPRGVGGGLLCV